MTVAAKPIALTSPGPVAEAFMRSRAFIVVIIGPVGSGKTMAMLQKGVRNGAMQGARIDERGIKRRRAKFGVIRESYPSLDANTLPSWFNITPKEYGHFSAKAPYSHKFQRVLRRDASRQPTDVLDMEVEFRAIGDQGVEAATRGWELNCAGVDEGDLQPEELISYLSGRVGRFSSLDPKLVVDPQILISSNAPFTDNYLYKLAIEKELGGLHDLASPELLVALEGRPLIECFIQPGGLEPGAENLHNLRGGRGYYLLQQATNKHRPDYVDRMIHNKFVPVRHGLPVHPQFSYSEHVAKETIEWDRRRKLIVGVDQGLFAAAVLTQRTVMGELRTLGEVVAFQDGGKSLAKVGPTAFGKMLRAKIIERCPDITADQIRVVADPAAFAAADRDAEARELDWVPPFQKALGFKVYKAKTNREQLRLEAQRKAMSERGGYLIDPSCKHLIRGHLGGYHYRKADMTDGETRGHLEIADTIHTHIEDAEQYAALEGEHVISDIRGKSRERRTVRVDGDYNELGGI
ncbi:MAG: hypothetical protein V4522_08140 [Pseudomonadota bacterium]|jgi:hypothetical protein|uniref:hypothetical protein n=1 Tax=unclassified Sphingomonas TaxID=196159 RepID=UPI00053DB548|nr:hypothetical protein [Sphingomonas sp. Ant H11]